MATQYVGARYVPKFFENSSGTAEWKGNTIYEPLTIVTRNGNSYTSKKLVPASVGAPEYNEDYWVATGVYNEQFREYDRKIDNVITGYKEADLKVKNEVESDIQIEANARATADSGLEAQISEEVQDRISAVTSVANDLQEEITNRENADDDLQTQINEIVAPTGGAPSEAEITNARIGANGTVYSSLGDAIRSQVGFLDDSLFDFAQDENVGFLTTANDHKQLNNQLAVTDAAYSSVSDYITIPALTTKITVATKTNVNGSVTVILPQVFFFDENKTYISRSSDTDTSHNYGTFEIPENAVYVRVNQPASNVNMPRYIRFIQDGLVLKEGLTSNDDLNTIKKPGVYFLPYDNMPANTPADMPITSARLLVIKSVTSNNYSAAWQIMGVVNKLYFRVFSGGSWQDWETVANESDLADTIMGRDTLTHNSNLDTLTKSGMYFYTTGNVPEKAPTNAISRMTVFRSKTPENYSGVSNLVIANGGLFFRDRQATNNGYYTEWKSVGVESPIVQDETLPYNAVLYHAKWDSILRNRVLRRVNLGYVDDDASLPMYAYEFCPNRDFIDSSSASVNFDWSNALYPRPKVLIIGGQHGNEKCTPMDIWRIAKELIEGEHNELACKFDWYFIPLLNPWGYSHARLDSEGNVIYGNDGVTAEIVPCSATINAGIRENANGYNINRDWSDVIYSSGGKTYGFQTSELALIKDYVLGIKPDIFIDAHQGHNEDGVLMVGAPRKSNGDAEYNKIIDKVYTYLDMANGAYDTIFKKYKLSMANTKQYARVWPQINSATSDHYFAGATVNIGGVTVGNTQHQNLAIPCSICTETSEICYDFSGTHDWYNWVACTSSTTYLWKVINNIAKMI